MTSNERSDRAGERNRTDDLSADLRVHLHLLPFVRRQWAGLGENVLRHGELADVVQQRSDFDRLPVEVGHVDPACQRRGVVLNTLDVTTAAFVLRLNRARKYLRAVAVYLRPLGDAPLLFHDATV